MSAEDPRPMSPDPTGRRASLLHRLRVETHATWLAARDPSTPWAARLFGLLLAAYALSPIDLIPDFIPVLGLLDDLLIIPAGLWLFRRMLPPGQFERHRAEAERASERPRSVAGTVLIVIIWISLAVGALSLLRWSYA